MEFSHIEMDKEAKLIYLLDITIQRGELNISRASKWLPWKYIVKYPNVKWNWKKVSKNPNVTWKIVCDNPHFPWNYWHMSKNPNITCMDAMSAPYKQWNPDIISRKPDLCWNIIEKNPDWCWNWFSVWGHPGITLEDIIRNKNHKKMNWAAASLNINVKIDNIINPPEDGLKWNWSCISRGPNVTLDTVLNNLSMPWDLYHLAKNYIKFYKNEN